jgi:hypothetical protein
MAAWIKKQFDIIEENVKKWPKWKRKQIEESTDADWWDEQCMKCELGNQRCRCPFDDYSKTFVYCPQFQKKKGGAGGGV